MALRKRENTVNWEEVLERIICEIRFGTFRKTDYEIKEIDRMSAGTFSVIPDKLLSQTSRDLFIALSCDLISRHYYPSCTTQQEINSSEMK
jgi:hypothetical protein